MKFSLLSLLSLVAAANGDISATSDLGQSLLSSARRLNNDNNEADFTWMTNYSLKFQGCHADTSLQAGDNDAYIQTVKMAHFRLCPTNSCQTWLGSGCSSGYGDYVVDLQTFAKSYVQSQRRTREYECQLYQLASCDCQESDDRDDTFNRDYCEYDCYANSKMYQDCVDRNPYEEEQGGERQKRFEPERYMECRELEWESDDDNDVQYFIGPYCSQKGEFISALSIIYGMISYASNQSNCFVKSGTEVYLGLYTDEYCTEFADSTNGRATYKTLTSSELPYSSTSLITNDCVSCIEVEDLNRRQEEQKDQNQDDMYGNDVEDADELSEQCERLYESSGKCEGSLAAMEGSANNNACSYILGQLQYTNANGVVHRKSTGSTTANVFIGVLAAAFVALGAVAFKLKKSKCT